MRDGGSEEYWSDAPFLPAVVVERLIAARVRLVGVDFGNVDDTGDLSRPAHTGLLAAGIPIVENLRGLERLPSEGFVFSAPPPRDRARRSVPGTGVRGGPVSARRRRS